MTQKIKDFEKWLWEKSELWARDDALNFGYTLEKETKHKLEVPPTANNSSEGNEDDERTI